MKRLTRRTLLRGAGGVALALPFLEAMRPARARAATGPKRFVVFFSSNGTIYDAWRPTGGETDFKLGTILAPLEPHRRDLLILQGVHMESSYNGPGGNNHDMGMGHMLTGEHLVVGPGGKKAFDHLSDGSAGGPSIDQAIANQIGGGSRFRSIELGVESSTNKVDPFVRRMCYRAPFQPLLPMDDPRAVFSLLFSDQAAAPGAAAKLHERRRTVLDSVLEDHAALAAKLGTEDRRKLDGHLTSLREIEKRLVGGGGAAPAPVRCAKPTAPAAPMDFPAAGLLQMDLLAMALACDLTRVISLQWSTAESVTVHRWLGVTGEHHVTSHEGDSNARAVQDLVKINEWYAKQFAYLLQKLKGLSDDTGPLLDSSLVFWTNEQGKGNSHSRRDIPYVLAGSAGGALRTGRYFKAPGVPHNNLFVSFLNMFGSSAKSFGNPAYCTGALAGLG